MGCGGDSPCLHPHMRGWTGDGDVSEMPLSTKCVFGVPNRHYARIVWTFTITVFLQVTAGKELRSPPVRHPSVDHWAEPVARQWVKPTENQWEDELSGDGPPDDGVKSRSAGWKVHSSLRRQGTGEEISMETPRRKSPSSEISSLDIVLARSSFSYEGPSSALSQSLTTTSPVFQSSAIPVPSVPQTLTPLLTSFHVPYDSLLIGSDSWRATQSSSYLLLSTTPSSVAFSHFSFSSDVSTPTVSQSKNAEQLSSLLDIQSEHRHSLYFSQSMSSSRVIVSESSQSRDSRQISKIEFFDNLSFIVQSGDLTDDLVSSPPETFNTEFQDHVSSTFFTEQRKSEEYISFSNIFSSSLINPIDSLLFIDINESQPYEYSSFATPSTEISLQPSETYTQSIFSNESELILSSTILTTPAFAINLSPTRVSYLKISTASHQEESSSETDWFSPTETTSLHKTPQEIRTWHASEMSSTFKETDPSEMPEYDWSEDTPLTDFSEITLISSEIITTATQELDLLDITQSYKISTILPDTEMPESDWSEDTPLTDFSEITLISSEIITTATQELDLSDKTQSYKISTILPNTEMSESDWSEDTPLTDFSEITLISSEIITTATQELDFSDITQLYKISTILPDTNVIQSETAVWELPGSQPEMTSDSVPLSYTSSTSFQDTNEEITSTDKEEETTTSPRHGRSMNTYLSFPHYLITSVLKQTEILLHSRFFSSLQEAGFNDSDENVPLFVSSTLSSQEIEPKSDTEETPPPFDDHLWSHSTEMATSWSPMSSPSPDAFTIQLDSTSQSTFPSETPIYPETTSEVTTDNAGSLSWSSGPPSSSLSRSGISQSDDESTSPSVFSPLIHQREESTVFELSTIHSRLDDDSSFVENHTDFTQSFTVASTPAGSIDSSYGTNRTGKSYQDKNSSTSTAEDVNTFFLDLTDSIFVTSTSENETISHQNGGESTTTEVTFKDESSTTIQSSTISEDVTDIMLSSQVQNWTVPDNGIFSDEKFWVRTEVEFNGIDVSSELSNFTEKLERAFLSALDHEKKNSRPKRKAENDVTVTIIGWSVNLSLRHLSLLYVVRKNGNLLPATSVVDTLRHLPREDFQQTLNLPVLVQAEEYTKKESLRSANKESHWIIMAAIGGTGVIVAVLLCVLLRCRWRRKSAPLSEESEPNSPTYGSQNRQQAMEEGVLRMHAPAVEDAVKDQDTSDKSKRPLPSIPSIIDAKRASKRFKRLLEPKSPGPGLVSEETQTEEGGLDNPTYGDDSSNGSANSKPARKPIKITRNASAMTDNLDVQSQQGGFFDHVHPSPSEDSTDTATLPLKSPLRSSSGRKKLPSTKPERQLQTENAATAEKSQKTSSRRSAHVKKMQQKIVQAVDEAMTLVASHRSHSVGAIDDSQRLSVPTQQDEDAKAKVVWSHFKSEASPQTQESPQSPSSTRIQAESATASNTTLFNKKPRHTSPRVSPTEEQRRPGTAPPTVVPSTSSTTVLTLNGESKDELDVVYALKMKSPAQSVVEAIREELKRFQSPLPGSNTESFA